MKIQQLEDELAFQTKNAADALEEVGRLRVENEGLRELVLRLAGVIERGSDYGGQRYLRYVPIGYSAKHALREVPSFVPVASDNQEDDDEEWGEDTAQQQLERGPR